jgi:hypothetical protein
MDRVANFIKRNDMNEEELRAISDRRRPTARHQQPKPATSVDAAAAGRQPKLKLLLPILFSLDVQQRESAASGRAIIWSKSEIAAPDISNGLIISFVLTNYCPAVNMRLN